VTPSPKPVRSIVRDRPPKNHLTGIGEGDYVSIFSINTGNINFINFS